MSVVKQFSFSAWFFLASLFFSLNTNADTNWSGAQSAGDYSSLGVVTVDGDAIFAAGTYTFDSLVVNSSRTITVNSNTGAGTGVIIIANNVTVNGTISANGTGFAGGAGPGAGNSRLGGCHGGHGGIPVAAVPCSPYGDPLQPTTLGSGGGNGTGTPGAGGGAIKLVVSNSLTLAGTISASGAAAVGSSGGGAGGSVWIVTKNISGAGSVIAKGGDSSGNGAGSGGRVLLSYSGTNSLTGTVTAPGGADGQTLAATSGSALIVDSTNNDLYVKSESAFANGTYTFRNITITSTGRLWVDRMGFGSNSGPGVGGIISQIGAGSSHGGRGGIGGTWAAAGVTYGSALEPVTKGSGGAAAGSDQGGFGGGALKLVATGTLTLDGKISANAGGSIASSNKPGGGSGGSLWIVADKALGSGTFEAKGGNGISSSGGGGRIAVYYGTAYSSSLKYSAAIGTAGDSAGESDATVGSVVVIDNTNHNLSFPVSTSLSNGTYSFNNVTIPAGVQVWASDGSLPGEGPGAGVASTSSTNDGTGGGSYGGLGTAGSRTAAGVTYGSATAPSDVGSGGGKIFAVNNGFSGRGGGALKFVVSNAMTLGTGAVLSVNGGEWWSPGVSGQGGGGGGSGGSIWINTKTLSAPSSSILAQGGAGESAITRKGGGGGGGRIAIYCSSTCVTTSALSVTGGTGLTTGAAGTRNIYGYGPAVSLAFTQQPSANAIQGINFTPAAVVGASDSDGNVIPSYNTAVTVTAYSDAACTTPVTETLNGASNSSYTGLAFFSSMNYPRMATIYLKAESGALSTACSNAVVVDTNPATKLIFATQPSTTATMSEIFSQQPVVEGRDPNNLLDVTFNGVITIVAYTDSACTVMAGGNLLGSAITSLGVANYTGVAYSTSGNIYVKASSGSLTSACSTLVQVLVPQRPWFFRGF
ncbi:beta strand repeat-containing protein [Bdellovibrio sp. HCB274]|uniref:beta strand repeat-containing protein n=1 Tax=Bdellovibrio sp. HCB274 TaxID=3394361 RepID=UPI0039B44F82